MSANIARRSSFLTFNVGHLITIVVCVTGFVYGYGDLNRRVSNLESAVIDIKNEWKNVSTQLSISDKTVTSQLALMNVKLSTVENDLAWVKKNMK